MSAYGVRDTKIPRWNKAFSCTVLVQICAVLTDYISYEKNECVREPVQLKPIT